MGNTRDILSILEKLRPSGTNGPFSWVSMGEAVSLQKTPAFCLTLPGSYRRAWAGVWAGGHGTQYFWLSPVFREFMGDLELTVCSRKGA